MQPEVERELIRKCRAGDSGFYEPLVRAYEEPGLRLALGMMGNPDDERLDERPGDPARSPHRRAERAAAKRLLWDGLARISEEHREILVLKELQDLRYGEIAAILEIPEGTVASRLYHARRALKEALDEMGAVYP